MTFDSGTLLQNGTYKILNSHFEGGFGITYKATHIRLNTTRLIKVPNIRKRNGIDYKYIVEVFEREGTNLAKINPPHPHIVAIYDFFDETVKIEGFSGKVPCLVMEFIEGETLFSLVNNQDKLSEAAAIKYIKQIASALALCHKHGIVHRDVKPENIILRENSDDVVLIDFGLAGNQGTEYNAGRTQDFAPWEQIARLTDFPTSEYRKIVQKFKSQPTVDIYSLSATLYYLVTLEPPVNSWTRYEKHQNDPLVSPKIKNPELSEEINTAILKGLNTDPKKRPQTIEEWLKYLPEPQANISINRTEPDIPTKHEPVLPAEKPQPKVISKTEPNGLIRFYDFDSLIEPEKTINGDYIIHECRRNFNIKFLDEDKWVSGGFGHPPLCNYTTNEYPRHIEQYFDCFRFNENYPPEYNQPAIMAGIIKDNDQLFSVVSVATRSLDDGGRSIIAYRHFFCRGNKLEAVLAWIEKFRTEHGDYRIFNPFEPKQIGDYHTISKQEIQYFCQNLPSIREDILQQHSPIILSSEQFTIQEIHTIARLKSRGKEAMVWSFHSTFLTSPELFTVIHYANEEYGRKEVARINEDIRRKEKRLAEMERRKEEEHLAEMERRKEEERLAEMERRKEEKRKEEERLRQQENRKVMQGSIAVPAAYIFRSFINKKNNNKNKQDKLDLSIFFGEEIAVLAKEEIAKKAARIRLIVLASISSNSVLLAFGAYLVLGLGLVFLGNVYSILPNPVTKLPELIGANVKDNQQDLDKIVYNIKLEVVTNLQNRNINNEFIKQSILKAICLNQDKCLNENFVINKEWIEQIYQYQSSKNLKTTGNLDEATSKMIERDAIEILLSVNVKDTEKSLKQIINNVKSGIGDGKFKQKNISDEDIKTAILKVICLNKNNCLDKKFTFNQKWVRQIYRYQSVRKLKINGNLDQVTSKKIENEVIEILKSQYRKLEPETPVVTNVPINYTNLLQLLTEGNWRQADLETDALIQKTQQGSRCTELKTINQMWLKYSGGKFGYTPQLKTWKSIISQKYDKPYDIFGNQVGWRINEVWLLQHDQLNFSLEQAPVGQLPWSGWQIELYSLYRKGFGDFMTEVEKCQLID